MTWPETAALLGCATVLLGFAPAVAVALAPPRGNATASLRLLTGVAATVLVMRVGPWAFASVDLRNIAGAAFLIGSLVGMARAVRARQGKRGRPLLWAILAAPLVGLVAWAFAGTQFAEPGVDLAALPLGPGAYAVVQGGSTKPTSPLARGPGPSAGLDLVRLAPSGNRAHRFVPASLADHASYGAPVRSPCAGEVLHAADDAADVPTGAPLPALTGAAAAGNAVVVRCPGAVVALRHLQRGSVKVKAGLKVRPGQELGAMGNSGVSLEPHLHVAAFPEGTAVDDALAESGRVPMRFGGHVLVTNTSFTVESK